MTRSSWEHENASSSAELTTFADRKGPSTTAQYTDMPSGQGQSSLQSSESDTVDRDCLISTTEQAHVATPYRTYRRRWFGLLQLTLLNIIVSWDWLTYAPVSTTASQFFDVRVSTINWLSTAFLFAFVVATPATIYILNRGGPKPAIATAGALIFFGNWIRYGGARAANSQVGFGLTMFGQILTGLAQPFVLSAPTRYSDMWFQEKGRIGATALASLANPFGGALGQLINPFWATKASDVPNMVLYVAIISTIASAPSFFIPHHPATPPTPTSTTTTRTPLTLSTLKTLYTNPHYLILSTSFTLLVTSFNALSSLLTTILTPYGYSETASGLTGALLIIAGLISGAVTSPLLDRHPRLRIPVIKFLVMALAPLYTAFVFAPATRGYAAPYIISALIGAASFSLLPLALEAMVDVTYPVSPEISSAVCWAGGQAGGAVAIVVMDALQGVWKRGEPERNLKAGLVLLAVLAWGAVPGVSLLGWRGLGLGRRGRDGG